MTIIYDPHNGILTQTQHLDNDNDLKIITTIHMDQGTISYSNNSNVSDVEKLNESHIYTFKSILENIKMNDHLINKLTKMSYFIDTYLPYSAGSFVTPYPERSTIGYLFLFSTLFVPYQMIDIEMARSIPFMNVTLRQFHFTRKKLLDGF